MLSFYKVLYFQSALAQSPPPSTYNRESLTLLERGRVALLNSKVNYVEPLGEK